MNVEQSLDTRNDPIREEELNSSKQYPNLKEALENLQGNILRGHGRHYSVHLFLQFHVTRKPR
jgi:hypothetical protein